MGWSPLAVGIFDPVRRLTNGQCQRGSSYWGIGEFAFGTLADDLSKKVNSEPRDRFLIVYGGSLYSEFSSNENWKRQSHNPFSFGRMPSFGQRPPPEEDGKRFNMVPSQFNSNKSRPMSRRKYFPANSTRSAPANAFPRAASRSFPKAVTAKTRPPFVWTSSPTVLVPA